MYSYSNKSKKMHNFIVLLLINACMFRSLQQAEGQSCVEMHCLHALIITQKHDCPEEDIDFFTVY